MIVHPYLTVRVCPGSMNSRFVEFVAQEQFGKSVIGLVNCRRYVTLTSSGRCALDGKNIARREYKLASLLVTASSKLFLRIWHVGAFAGSGLLQPQPPALCARIVHTRSTSRASSRALNHIVAGILIVQCRTALIYIMQNGRGS